jgi:hypothetical protein
MTRNLDRHWIGKDFACPLMVFHPRYMGQRNPYRTFTHQELYIDRVGMPGSDGNNQRLIPAVHRSARPAVNRLEVVVHI